MSKYGDQTHNWFESLVNVVGGKERADALIRGELAVVEKVSRVSPPTKKRKNLKTSPIIHVDRSIAPTYPSWMKEVMYPELEKTGPSQFDVRKLEHWLHEDQKGGKTIIAQNILKHLKDNNMLEDCLGLRDLEEIQRRGFEFFRQHFLDKVIFGWKSVLRDSFGDLHAPCLCEVGGRVVHRWCWLGFGWSGGSPALRFAK